MLTTNRFYLVVAITLASAYALATSFAGIVDAVQAIGAKYSAPTGLEVSPDEEGSIELDGPAKTAAEELNQLIALRPQYVWELQDGVFDVYPKTKSVSGIRISSFAMANANRNDVYQALGRLPEIRSWLADHHASWAIILNGTYGPNKNPNQRVSFQVKDVPLRALLNKLVNQFGDPYWLVGTPGKSLAVYF